MLNYLKEEANRTLTENGAATYRSTGSHCLDLFASVGALRHAGEEEIEKRFLRAYIENPDLTMKLLFYARDIRGGLGERRLFRTALHRLAWEHRGSVAKNLPLVGEYGRWDDLLALLDTPCEREALEVLRGRLQADLEALKGEGAVSLLGKWLPSANASSPATVAAAKRLARGFGMSEAAYRKNLTALRRRIRILENNLRERDYTFDYERQPSRALFKYRKAFLRNDRARYEDFLDRVERGTAVLHTGTLLPYDVIAPLMQGERTLTEEERRVMNTSWNALEDFTCGENALAVVDGSGSMYWGRNPMPAAVALSLGVYFAQRCTGAFHNHFITFSTHPQLVKIRGGDLAEQISYCAGFNEAANTNLQAVFDLILSAAVKNHVPQRELPGALYFITDMEFDSCAECAGETNFARAARRFAEHGYTLPRVVFWNVHSRNDQQPVAQNERGVTLVSGCTPRIFSMLRSGAVTPLAFMLEVLGSERYQPISA